MVRYILSYKYLNINKIQLIIYALMHCINLTINSFFFSKFMGTKMHSRSLIKKQRRRSVNRNNNRQNKNTKEDDIRKKTQNKINKSIKQPTTMDNNSDKEEIITTITLQEKEQLINTFNLENNDDTIKAKIREYLMTNKYHSAILKLSIPHNNIIISINIAYSLLKQNISNISNECIMFNVLFILKNIIKYNLLSYITENQLTQIFSTVENFLSTKHTITHLTTYMYLEKIYKYIKNIVDLNTSNTFLSDAYISLLYKILLKTSKINSNIKIAIINYAIKNNDRLLFSILEYILDNYIDENKNILYDNFKINNKTYDKEENDNNICDDSKTINKITTIRNINNIDFISHIIILFLEQ
ncbi:hypothetical protein SLOPH_550, partial [Spraguea lophii 42_110]